MNYEESLESVALFGTDMVSIFLNYCQMFIVHVDHYLSMKLCG